VRLKKIRITTSLRLAREQHQKAPKFHCADKSLTGTSCELQNDDLSRHDGWTDIMQSDLKGRGEGKGDHRSVCGKVIKVAEWTMDLMASDHLD